MKIAIIGYGKMGHIIEAQALMRGHEIVARVDNADDKEWDCVRDADVAIEFSMPAVAEANVSRCLDLGLPVVSGTTGWSDGVQRLKERPGGAWLLWSSNFSIGVYVFRKVNRLLTRLMSRYPSYTPVLKEVHHIHKLDHPSGTAVTVAEDMIAADDRLKGWTEGASDPSLLHIEAERRGEVPGIHSVKWDSPVDSITLTHEAKGREGFALGAVIAAEWLINHPGFHTIDDLLDTDL